MEKNLEKIPVKKIVENIPLIGTLIICLGFVKLLLFYSAFSVPIMQYISISEITSTIIEDLLFLFLVFVFFLGITSTRSEIDKLKSIDTKGKKNNTLKRFSLIILFILLLIGLIFIKQYYWKIIIYGAIFLIASQAIFYSKWMNLFLVNKYKFVLNYFSLSLFVLAILTAFNIRDIKSGKFNSSRITTVDTTFIVSNSCLFIGRTEKYTFLSLDSNKIVVIPNVSIKLQIIRQR